MLEPNNIYCGDSYKLIKEIPDKSVDCVYVDIPYLYTSNYNKNKNNCGKKIKDEFIGELNPIINGIDYSILDEFVRIMKKINCFIWCSKEQLLTIIQYFQNKGCMFNILFWGKDNVFPLANNSWLSDIEYCLYFREKGVLLNDGYEIKRQWFISNFNQRDKIKFSHPTIKPIELVKRHLLHTTQPNDIVLDCFMGSGTTCVASKDIGRRYIGIEIEKKWFDIAKNRLEGTDASGQMSLFLR